ncbi:MAG: L,D-transpeptidase family protein [Magnetovibrio sp.]|nr:L,D-transpeptidase family protein [Magnetovibrio sp.]
MDIVVFPDHRLIWQTVTYRCAIGRGGVIDNKREGDGGTPAGRYPLRRVFYRPDRVRGVETGLPVEAIGRDDGWCDDPARPEYNTRVQLPFPGGHETMWRDDHLYDIVVEVGYNDDPPVAGRGSAIFMHVARPDYAATEGCVALSPDDLVAVLATCTPATWLNVSLLEA